MNLFISPKTHKNSLNKYNKTDYINETSRHMLHDSNNEHVTSCRYYMIRIETGVGAGIVSLKVL
jgi:hypothetical protein